MPYSVRPFPQCGSKRDAKAAYWDDARPAGTRRLTGLVALILGNLAAAGFAAASDISPVVVYEANGIRATAHADCDTSAYTLVSLTDGGAAERYAARDKFGAQVEAYLPEIMSASAAWLDGDAGALCDGSTKAETITLVGVVNALPIYAAAARRTAGWQVGSAMPDARDISMFASVLPELESVRCETFEETVGSKIEKYRTRIFTIRAAHTTGQWSHMQALTNLVPLHQEIMSLVGDWSFEWQCTDVFELAGVAILADEERAALLKWNQAKIRARLAETSTPDAAAAVMAETYRLRALPPVSSIHDIPHETTIRYGGYLSPSVEDTEAVFAGANG